MAAAGRSTSFGALARQGDQRRPRSGLTRVAPAASLSFQSHRLPCSKKSDGASAWLSVPGPRVALIRSRGGTRRRPLVVKAAGDSDVPAFQGFPPMQTRPAWYWRIAAVLPYMLPVCEGWLYNEPAMALFHPFFQYKLLCLPFITFLGYLPSWFLLAYFLGAYLGIVRNNRWPHFFRFHVITGMLLEIILQVTGTLNDWLPASVVWGRLGAHFWLAISIAYVCIVLQCIFSALQGMYADVPFVSDASYMQIPYE